MRQQSVVLQVLGTLTLWLGWFAFNGGSVLSRPRAGIAAHCVLHNHCSGAAACLSTGVFFYATKRRVDPAAACNGILAGLVAITPGCATSNALGAILTGLVAGPLYGASAHFVEYKLRIDDVCSAVSVHATCGMWGLIAAALFATPRYYDAAYETSRGDRCMGAFYGGKGNSLAVAIVFILLDAAWVAVPVLGLFAVMKRTCGVRSDFGAAPRILSSIRRSTGTLLPTSVKMPGMPGSVELRAPAGSTTPSYGPRRRAASPRPVSRPRDPLPRHWRQWRDPTPATACLHGPRVGLLARARASSRKPRSRSPTSLPQVGDGAARDLDGARARRRLDLDGQTCSSRWGSW